MFGSRTIAERAATTSTSPTALGEDFIMVTLITPNPQDQPDIDFCAGCARPINANPKWVNDQPFCPSCAMIMASQGHMLHGSRVQGRFWDAAEQARPGGAASWLQEEYEITIDGKQYRGDFVAIHLP